MEIGVSQVCLLYFRPHHIQLHVVLDGKGDAGEDAMPNRRSLPAGGACKGFCHSYVLGARTPLCQLPRSLISNQSCPVYGDPQVGALVLNGLKAAYGASELDSDLGVVYDEVKDFLGASHYLTTLDNGSPVNGFPQRSSALV